RFATNDALLYTAQQLNLGEFYAALRGPGGDAAGTILDPRLARLLDAKSNDDILGKLALFKGEMSLLIDYVPKPTAKMDTWIDLLSGFQFVLALEVDKDNATADQSLLATMTKVEAATGQQYVKVSYNGTPVYYQRGAAAGEDRSTTVPLGLLANLKTTD